MARIIALLIYVAFIRLGNSRVYTGEDLGQRVSRGGHDWVPRLHQVLRVTETQQVRW